MAMDLMPAINLNNAAAEYGRETISFQFECHREGQLKLRYSLPFNRRVIHGKYCFSSSDKYTFLHWSRSSFVKINSTARQNNKDVFGFGFQFPGANIKHHPHSALLQSNYQPAWKTCSVFSSFLKLCYFDRTQAALKQYIRSRFLLKVALGSEFQIKTQKQKEKRNYYTDKIWVCNLYTAGCKRMHEKVGLEGKKITSCSQNFLCWCLSDNKITQNTWNPPKCKQEISIKKNWPNMWVWSFRKIKTVMRRSKWKSDKNHFFQRDFRWIDD